MLPKLYHSETPRKPNQNQTKTSENPTETRQKNTRKPKPKPKNKKNKDLRTKTQTKNPQKKACQRRLLLNLSTYLAELVQGSRGARIEVALEVHISCGGETLKL